MVSLETAHDEITPYKRGIIEKFDIPIISPGYIDACIAQKKLLPVTSYLVASRYHLDYKNEYYS